MMGFILFLPFSSRGEEVGDLFAKLRSGKYVVIDSVHYTGSDFAKAVKGFLMQRGRGKGWTRGERITVSKVKPKTIARLAAAFKSYLDKGYGYRGEDRACFYYDPDNEFYAYQYDAGTQTLWMLKASVGKEICVPSDWTTLDFLDATEPDPFEKADTAQLKILGLSRLWQGVNRWFVFRDRMTVNWDSLYVAAMPEMLAARTEEESLEVLQKMVAYAKDGHTYVYGSSRKYPAPFTTIMIDSCVYIKEVLSDKLALKPGLEIKEIDDLPVREYARRYVVPYIASSTPQWTIHEAFDGRGLLMRMEGDTVKVELKDGSVVRYVSGSDKRDIRSRQKPIFQLSRPTKDIALLKINTFMGNDFQKQFSEVYDSLYESKALILDIRGNGGGNSGNGDFVMRMLCTDSIPTGHWESPTYIPAFTSWRITPEPYRGGGEKMAPFKDVPLYGNPIVILADRGTFSAAEDFIGLFRGAKRGTVIGTPTGGSTGNGVRIELIPGHSWANICSKHDTAPDGTEFVGSGFQPDIQVEETWKSLFEDPIDRATLKALEYLNGLLEK